MHTEQAGSTGRALRHYAHMADLAQIPEREVVRFLAKKYTQQGRISIGDVMCLYGCSEHDAHRVIDALLEDDVLAATGEGCYRVSV